MEDKTEQQVASMYFNDILNQQQQQQQKQKQKQNQLQQLQPQQDSKHKVNSVKSSASVTAEILEIRNSKSKKKEKVKKVKVKQIKVKQMKIKMKAKKVKIPTKETETPNDTNNIRKDHILKKNLKHSGLRKKFTSKTRTFTSKHDYEKNDSKLKHIPINEITKTISKKKKKKKKSLVTNESNKHSNKHSLTNVDKHQKSTAVCKDDNLKKNSKQQITTDNEYNQNNIKSIKKPKENCTTDSVKQLLQFKEIKTKSKKAVFKNVVNGLNGEIIKLFR